MNFEVKVADQPSFEIELNTPGEHNVLNSLAAIAIGLELGVPVNSIQTALRNFAGVGRRFEVYESTKIAGLAIAIILPAIVIPLLYKFYKSIKKR